jgi:uncharacterized protein YbjT (DUF2867 family)
MKILVTTPMGKIGRRIVPELLAPEFSVRLIVRDPARLPLDIQRQVEVVRGSTDDVVTLRRALHGVEALFWCVPPPSLQETHVERHYEEFACAGWQTIRQAGTPRVVTISAGGKGLARRAGPISGLHAMEEILNESGAAIRHLRCSFFMDNFLSKERSIRREGVVSYPMPGHIPIPMTAVTDVADVALRWLVRQDWTGIQSVAVHGPEDLTLGQAAAVIGRVLEQTVRYEQTSVEDYIEGLMSMGATVEYAYSMAEMFARLARGISRAEPRTPESTTSTTLMTWAQTELLPTVKSLAPHLETAAATQDLSRVFHPNAHWNFSGSDWECVTRHGRS